MMINNHKISSEWKKNQHNAVILLMIVSLAFVINSAANVSAEEIPVVPEWLKLTTVWWSENKISDQDYISTLQYLIENKLLVIPEPGPDITISESICGPYLTLNTTVSIQTSSRCTFIPSWGSAGFSDELGLITNSTGIFIDSIEIQQQIVITWVRMVSLGWSQDTISDQEFINILQYLVEYKILEIPEPEPEPLVLYVPEPKPEDESVLNISTSWTNIARIGDFFVQGHPDVIDSRISQAEYFFQITLVGEGAGTRDCSLAPDPIDCVSKSANRAGKTVASDGTVSILITDDENRLLYLDSFSVRKTEFKRAFDTATDEEYLAFGWDVDVSNVKRGYGTFGTAKVVFTDRGGNSFLKEFDTVSIPQFN